MNKSQTRIAFGNKEHTQSRKSETPFGNKEHTKSRKSETPFGNHEHRRLPLETKNKQNHENRRLPLETKNTQNHDNRRLGLIESLHMQHCSLRGSISTPPPPPPPPPPGAGLSDIRFSKITRMGPMIPKEIKYNLHYDDVRGDFLRPPQTHKMRRTATEEPPWNGQ